MLYIYSFILLLFNDLAPIQLIYNIHKLEKNEKNNCVGIV